MPVKKVSTKKQRYPVNRIPAGTAWGSVRSNAEKAQHADWNGDARERPTDSDRSKVITPKKPQ